MAASCAICKQELEDGEELVRLGCLRGPYHEECVNAHVQVHGLDFANFPCPECRAAERQLQSMEAARLQRQQVVSSSGSSAAAGRRRTAVFRTPLTQGGERRITRESRRSRSPPPRVVADSPITQPESPGGAIVAAASPIGRAVAPAASPIGRGLSQPISPSQSQPSRPQGPAITDADFGFTFTDNTAAGGDGAPVPDPCFRRADAVPNAAAFRTALHPTGLFNGLQGERGARETAKQWLGEMLADPRDHKEVGMDPSFSIRLLLPRPFRTAVVAVASREGWQPEALAQGIMSNAGWLGHHATDDQCPRRCAEEALEALGARNAQQGSPRAQCTWLPPGIPRAQCENSALWRRELLRARPASAAAKVTGGAAGAPGAARGKKLRKDAPAMRELRARPGGAEAAASGASPVLARVGGSAAVKTLEEGHDFWQDDLDYCAGLTNSAVDPALKRLGSECLAAMILASLETSARRPRWNGRAPHRRVAREQRGATARARPPRRGGRHHAAGPAPRRQDLRAPSDARQRQIHHPRPDAVLGEMCGPDRRRGPFRGRDRGGRDFMEFSVSTAEMRLLRLEAYASREGRLGRCTSIQDMTCPEGILNVWLRNRGRQPMLRTMSHTIDTYYPGMLGKVLLINAPWAVHGILKVLWPVLPARIADKIETVSASQTPARLRELVDPAHLPCFLGGDIPDDEFVPSRKVPSQGSGDEELDGRQKGERGGEAPLLSHHPEPFVPGRGTDVEVELDGHGGLP
ncbi:unnamed protein product [Prorocentrum cordatum]|uniref:CRAL-TRIO domain-containing protein n=1 Tax=Prorocentrum cordatum TaxID=2364126 RepID=A0ABN9U2Q1_9DINO|nr:unnamed protein product [Polarella glacialis]